MQDKGDIAVRFINQLTHTRGKWARKPFRLRPWQEHRIIRPLFGTLRKDGRRQYRTALLMLPRKQGKSTLCAGIGMHCLAGEREMGGEIIIGAGSFQQGNHTFSEAKGMTLNDSTLAKLCRINETQKSITYQPTNSTLRVIAADGDLAHGWNCSVFIADELHVWKKRDLWDAMTTSQSAREQPITLGISTAGYDRTSLLYELYDYACKVRDGIVDDPTFLPVIYEAPPEADWTDEKVWHDACPALGDFCSLEEMQRQFREAQNIASRENVFRRLFLNQWTDTATRWISSEAWDACYQDFDPAELDGRECYGGLDLSSTTDLTSFVLVFPNVNGRRYVLSTCWIPADSARERERRDRAPYTTWIRNRQIQSTGGNSIDYDAIYQHILEASRRYYIRSIGCDRWNAMAMIGQLTNAGLNVLAFGQGYKDMSPAAKELERQVLAGELAHNNDPVLNWCLSNCMVETDAAGNIKPSKAKSTERIDAVVALTMATGVANLNVNDNAPELIIL